MGVESFLPIVQGYAAGRLAWVDVLVEAAAFEWRQAHIGNSLDGSPWPQPGTLQEVDAAEDYGWITADEAEQLYGQLSTDLEDA